MSSRRSRRASSRTAASDPRSSVGLSVARSFMTCTSAAPPTDLRLQLLDQLQILGQTAEIATAVLGDDDEILDPHAELTGQVDARLNRHHFAGGEHVLRARREARLLVHLEPDAVAEAVAEALAVPGGGDR